VSACEGASLERGHGRRARLPASESCSFVHSKPFPSCGEGRKEGSRASHDEDDADAITCCVVLVCCYRVVAVIVVVVVAVSVFV